MKMQELRREAGLSNTHLAQQAGIDTPTLSRIETGKVLPTPLVLRRICETLYQDPLDIYEKHEIDLIGCMGNNKPVRAIKERGKGFYLKCNLSEI